MVSPLPKPYFPMPPGEYDRRYFAEIIRAFSVYLENATNPGRIRGTELTLTTSSGNVDQGSLSWNIEEETVDLTMGGGVTQQIGFETYMRAKNETGSTIPNGTIVGFSGVASDNGPTIAPYIADGTFDELYFIGVTTYDMPHLETGPVTIYGKINDIDTIGQNGETWSIGDILYASPTVAGTFTNVRPTAPDVVIVVAAVLHVDENEGVILVRPTIPLGLDYGYFDSTSTKTLAATNTATAIPLNHTLSANGVSLVDSTKITASHAGYYNLQTMIQLSSKSSSAKTVYFWIRKNGTNLVDSTRAFTNDINNGYTPLAINHQISLEAGDYIELYWAANSVDVTLEPITGLSFAPDAASVMVSLLQVQL